MVATFSLLLTEYFLSATDRCKWEKRLPMQTIRALYEVYTERWRIKPYDSQQAMI